MNALKLSQAAAVLALAAGLAQTATAQSVSFTGANYSQDFDSLSNTGATNTWTNGTAPLNGWHSYFGPSTSNTTRDVSTTAATNYRADTGTSTSGALYSYGSAASIERALGTISSGSAESVIGLVIQNNAANAITTFTLTYDGEQWRNGGNTSAQTLVFDFIVLSSVPVLADLDAANTTGYTAVAALNFTSPTVGATAAALDGNAAANRVAGITSTVTVSVPTGSYLVLRWWDNNDPGNDHGLAIDKLTFGATVAPAPAGAALLGLGGLLVARRRRA